MNPAKARTQAILNDIAEPIENLEAENEEEKEEEEEGEEDEEEEDQPVWEVREIIDVKIQHGLLNFLVVWDLDGAKSWEPSTNFPDEFDHEKIQDYASKYPRKYKKALAKLASNPNKWSYTRIDEDSQEVSDEEE